MYLLHDLAFIKTPSPNTASNALLASWASSRPRLCAEEEEEEEVVVVVKLFFVFRLPSFAVL
jgi:hypothetical protein